MMNKKSKLRRELISLRNLYNDSINSSKEINKKLIKILKPYQRIALYYPINNEVDVWPVVTYLKAQGKEVYLPQTKNEISFGLFTDIKNLKPGVFKILEPSDNFIDPTYLDVIVIPAIGISEKGYRLGYGAGYYDRALQGYCGLKIGVIYDFQLIAEYFNEAHDIRLDYIITDKNIIKIGEADV